MSGEAEDVRKFCVTDEKYILPCVGGQCEMAGMPQTASREVCPAGTFSTTEGCPKMMEIQDLLREVRPFCDGTSGAFSRETEFAA